MRKLLLTLILTVPFAAMANSELNGEDVVSDHSESRNRPDPSARSVVVHFNKDGVPIAVAHSSHARVKTTDLDKLVFAQVVAAAEEPNKLPQSTPATENNNTQGTPQWGFAGGGFRGGGFRGGGFGGGGFRGGGFGGGGFRGGGFGIGGFRGGGFRGGGWGGGWGGGGWGGGLGWGGGGWGWNNGWGGWNTGWNSNWGGCGWGGCGCSSCSIPIYVYAGCNYQPTGFWGGGFGGGYGGGGGDFYGMYQPSYY